MLTEEERDFLERYGDGILVDGIRRLIDEHKARSSR